MQQVDGESTLLDTLPYAVSTNNWIDKMIIHAVKIAVVMCLGMTVARVRTHKRSTAIVFLYYINLSSFHSSCLLAPHSIRKAYKSMVDPPMLCTTTTYCID